MAQSAQLRDKYRSEVVPKLREEFKYTNIMEVPRLEKVVISIGLGEAVQNAKVVDHAVGDLALIAGQRPVITKARRSIATYKLREGMNIGTMVTLRSRNMWEFLTRLLNVAIPRVRDFKGLSPKSFDGRGNYSMGIKEQIIFPEIDYDKIDKIRGMNITVVTSAKTDEEARALLRHLGMPFRK